MYGRERWMEITKEDKRSVIDHCYLAYFISGMVILIFGVILPNLIEERNLSFTAAGGLLSFLAIGNLCSSLVYPVFCGMMSQKTAVVVLAVPYPVCLFLFTMGLPVPVLYVMIFLIGITKGMITIINNHAIRQVTGSSNQYLNLLHMWYAVGAFLSPFVTMLLMGAGMNWKTILRLLAVLTVLIVLSYATMDYRKIEKEEKREAGEEHSQTAEPKEKFWFLKNTGFLLAVGALFFYMGLENSVNGWFVTYLKSTGFMSASLATVMVSVTWIMIMIGRIAIASISKSVPPAKILAVISVLQFVSVLILVFADHTTMAVAALILFLANNTAMAVAALVLLGLGMAGAFPTTTAFTGDLMGNSPLGMSVFTGIGSLGGILTPQVIGVLADKLGFQAAILFLVLDAFLLALFGVGALRYAANQKNQAERP